MGWLLAATAGAAAANADTAIVAFASNSPARFKANAALNISPPFPKDSDECHAVVFRLFELMFFIFELARTSVFVWLE
jgi:hypothetical protein